MKLKLLLTFTALVLALCFTLTACGKQQTGEATADSAETIADAAVPQSASNSASSEEGLSSAASSAEAASAPAEKNADTPEVSHGEETPAQEEGQQSSSSAASSQASSSASSKASSGNPAYQDDEKPSFTISMTNKTTNKTYTASCSYLTDKEEVASAAFFLPGGEYDVAVYRYTESKDKGEPLAKTTFKNSVAEGKHRSFRVNYMPKENRLEVAESTSSRNQ